MISVEFDGVVRIVNKSVQIASRSVQIANESVQIANGSDHGSVQIANESVQISDGKPSTTLFCVYYGGQNVLTNRDATNSNQSDNKFTNTKVDWGRFEELHLFCCVLR